MALLLLQLWLGGGKEEKRHAHWLPSLTENSPTLFEIYVVYRKIGKTMRKRILLPLLRSSLAWENLEPKSRILLSITAPFPAVHNTWKYDSPLSFLHIFPFPPALERPFSTVPPPGHAWPRLQNNF